MNPSGISGKSTRQVSMFALFYPPFYVQLDWEHHIHQRQATFQIVISLPTVAFGESQRLITNPNIRHIDAMRTTCMQLFGDYDYFMWDMDSSGVSYRQKNIYQVSRHRSNFIFIFLIPRSAGIKTEMRAEESVKWASRAAKSDVLYFCLSSH